MDGKKLRQILAVEGISQAKFAEFLGCTRQNVSAMLASDSVRLTTIEKLAELIGKSTQELLSGEQRPNRVEELEAEIRKKDAEIASLNARSRTSPFPFIAEQQMSNKSTHIYSK